MMLRSLFSRTIDTQGLASSRLFALRIVNRLSMFCRTFYCQRVARIAIMTIAATSSTIVKPLLLFRIGYYSRLWR